MVNDIEFVKACAATYQAKTPDVYGPIHGAYALTSRASDGTRLIAFRGSVTPHDWMIDAEALPSKKDEELGYCHSGFVESVDEILPHFEMFLAHSTPVYITGHSLGGADAVGLAVKLHLHGYNVKRVVTFGAPKFGSVKFWALSLPLAITQYRFGNDPIPTIPSGFRYLYTRTQTAVGTPCHTIDPFACHHIGNYVGALTAH